MMSSAIVESSVGTCRDFNRSFVSITNETDSILSHLVLNGLIMSSVDCYPWDILVRGVQAGSFLGDLMLI